MAGWLDVGAFASHMVAGMGHGVLIFPAPRIFGKRPTMVLIL